MSGFIRIQHRVAWSHIRGLFDNDNSSMVLLEKSGNVVTWLPSKFSFFMCGYILYSGTETSRFMRILSQVMFIFRICAAGILDMLFSWRRIVFRLGVQAAKLGNSGIPPPLLRLINGKFSGRVLASNPSDQSFLPIFIFFRFENFLKQNGGKVRRVNESHNCSSVIDFEASPNSAGNSAMKLDCKFNSSSFQSKSNVPFFT